MDRACLNCGSHSVGNFCASCGQRSRGSHRSLAQFGYDIVGDFRAVDATFWRTVWLLFFRPGRLTVEFNAGRRVRYLHPRKMYLLVSIVFFLLLSLLGDVHLFDIARYSPRTHALMQRDLVQTASEVTVSAGSMENRLDRALPERPHETLRPRLERRLDELRHMDREVLRDRFAHGLASNTPKMVFLLLPVFALLVMLFFGTKSHYYVDHVVFAFHAHIYFFIIAIACLLFERMTHDTRQASIALLIIVPYLLFATQTVYRNGWLTTGVKLFGLALSYAIVLGVSVVLLAASTLWWL